MRDLQKQAKEMERNAPPVGARLAAMQERMASVNQMMAMQTQAANTAAHTRNDQLTAEVSDLQEGLEMVEEKARFELGMVKPDEIYVQLSAPRR